MILKKAVWGAVRSFPLSRLRLPAAGGLLLAARRLLACAALMSAAGFCWAYDVEVDVGARAGSYLPGALGAFSWNAAGFSGALAAGTSAAGELSCDSGGNPGIDASFRAESSLSFGSFVAGLRLEADTLRSAEPQEESVELRLSVPFTLNGSDVSLSLSPVLSAGFYDDESLGLGFDFFASWAVGDFVLKPGAAISRSFSPDGSETLEVAPSLSFVWYPGIPVSADASAGWTRIESNAGASTTSFPVSLFVSAVPFPWLCVAASYESEIGTSGLSSCRVEVEVELVRYGARGIAFHLPVAAFYVLDHDSVRFGASARIGVSYGKE